MAEPWPSSQPEQMPDPVPTLRSVRPGRSCRACRRRHILCDRQQPCSYCRRLNARCQYPETRRRRVIQPENADHTNAADNGNTSIAERLAQVEAQLHHLTERYHADHEASTSARVTRNRTAHGRTPAPGASPTTHDPTSIPGRIKNDHAEMLSLLPLPERTFGLWQVYLENVDPIIKVLHVPTVQKQLLQASQNLESIPQSFVALMFAINYAAVSSMQNTTHTAVERRELLDKHGRGIEMALPRTRDMARSDLFVGQAMLIEALCARATGHRDGSWVKERVSSLIDLARDMEQNLTPASLFNREMWARLWGYIVVLDKLAVDYSSERKEAYIESHSRRSPCRIDDRILDPNMTRLIKLDGGRTEMDFALRIMNINGVLRDVYFAERSHIIRLSELAIDENIDERTAAWDQYDSMYVDSGTAIGQFIKLHTKTEVERMKIVHLFSRFNHIEGGHSPVLLSPVLKTAVEVLKSFPEARSSPTGVNKFLWFIQDRAEMFITGVIFHLLQQNPDCTLQDADWSVINAFFARSRKADGLNKDDPRWGFLDASYAAARLRPDYVA